MRTILRALARCPEALGKLNSAGKIIPGEVVGLNRALHYVVSRETIGKAAAAEMHVRTTWGDAGDVKGDNTKRGKLARHVLERIVTEALGHPIFAGKDRSDVLEALDADLSFRAGHMSVKKSKKVGRKKSKK
jgi:hypothetical protein